MIRLPSRGCDSSFIEVGSKSFMFCENTSGLILNGFWFYVVCIDILISWLCSFQNTCTNFIRLHDSMIQFNWSFVHFVLINSQIRIKMSNHFVIIKLKRFQDMSALLLDLIASLIFFFYSYTQNYHQRLFRYFTLELSTGPDW